MSWKIRIYKVWRDKIVPFLKNERTNSGGLQILQPDQIAAPWAPTACLSADFRPRFCGQGCVMTCL